MNIPPAFLVKSNSAGSIVVTVHMTKEPQIPQQEADLVFAGPENFEDCTHHIITALKHKGILAEPLGSRPDFQYSI